VDGPTGFDKNRGAIFGRRGLAAAVRSEAEDERPSPAASNPTLSAIFKDLARLNSFVRGQPEAYLRLGLSREWNNGTINAYWMQVNGVYTFPDFFKDIRSYK
jgi:hypothetical protein